MFNKIKNFLNSELFAFIMLVIILIVIGVVSGVTGEMYHV